MNKFKKIGLTALAASLVSVSANAGELTDLVQRQSLHLVIQELSEQLVLLHGQWVTA